jgi:hypothetical protein
MSSNFSAENSQSAEPVAGDKIKKGGTISPDQPTSAEGVNISAESISSADNNQNTGMGSSAASQQTQDGDGDDAEQPDSVYNYRSDEKVYKIFESLGGKMKSTKPKVIAKYLVKEAIRKAKKSSKGMGGSNISDLINDLNSARYFYRKMVVEKGKN